ncbi:hypothetical protein [Nonomuraea salmonea]|uniref:hypothetical protein n=1 Tax=Nonomuraea salmonea TaxID=46181 RepID=UPI0031F12B0E
MKPGRKASRPSRRHQRRPTNAGFLLDALHAVNARRAEGPAAYETYLVFVFEPPGPQISRSLGGERGDLLRAQRPVIRTDVVHGPPGQ